MLTPQTEAELSDMVRRAVGPLVARGGGTRAPVEGGTLGTTGLSGITLYEPGALTMVARAGTPMAEIEAAMASENQRLAFEPWRAARVLGRDGAPTLGGCVATNASGPRRMVAGACRDSVIGVRFVDGEGQVVKSGGRVMKNVTGLDLAKLVCGARGRLGVITEVSLKLLPGVETTASLLFHGLDTARAVALMSAALGTPYEVSGAAHDPQAGETVLRLEGLEASTAYRTGALRTALERFGAASIETGDDTLARWDDLRDGAIFLGSTDDLWRISLRPSHAPALAGILPGRHLLDWGGGLIWAETPPGFDLRAALTMPATATLVRAAPETHAALSTTHPDPAGVARLSDGIRARFDPMGRFGAVA